MIKAGNIRDILRRLFLRTLDIPSIDEFDEKDQKQIEEWLKLSVGQRGFHAYVKSRQRAFAQAMIGLPIETEKGRRTYYEYAGGLMEITRLYNRSVKGKKDD